MQTTPLLNNLKYTIVGAARSGLSCAKLLKKFSAHVFITEENKLTFQTEKMLQENDISYEHGGHNFEYIILNSDVIVISPGVLLNSPLLIKARESNIPILSEVEVASWFFPENVVCFGITGTNGKSTTTNYLASLLQLKYNAIACGNIGKPVSEVILETYEKNLTQNIFYLCIELSSYQLETIYSLNPLCTCFLNLQNDHLARYETENEYLKAKWRLILLTNENGLAIIDKYVLNQVIKAGLSLPKCKILVIDNEENTASSKNFTGESKNSVTHKINRGVQLPIAIYHELKKTPFAQLIPFDCFNTVKVSHDKNKNSSHIICHFINGKKELIWDIKNACLNGIHNTINILNASLIAEFIGLPLNFIFQQWEKESTQYIHLSHRLEQIGKNEQIFMDANNNKKHLTIINDSKATNVESTLVALKSFNKPIRLLLGGEPKGDSYLPIAKFIKENLVAIYPFGKAAPYISSELQSFSKNIAKNSINMLAASQQALIECDEGDILLLSPACSSLDEFKNFEHRGDAFRSWVISCFEENKS